MTVPSQIFDYLILPIREADQREGNDFLKRYLLGPQNVWEDTDQKIKDIPQLWSVVDCPDEFLKFLKWIVGWTSELDSVTQDLIFDELRRLISISGRLWKLRGPEDTVVDVMRFATGQRNRVWNWFDFRWVLADEGGEPDNITKPNGYLKFEINGILGTTPRPGTPIKAEYVPTVTSEDDLLSKWDTINSVNYVETTSTLGQGGSPSLTAGDYKIYDKVHLGTELGEEHEGRDPWMVDLPSPTDVGASQESNLRIVSNPAWDADEETRMRNLIVNLLKLMRATGERWEITYLGFLDQFIIDGDDTQWSKSLAITLVVADGKLTLGSPTTVGEATECIAPGTIWTQAVYSARLRSWVYDVADSGHGLFFHSTGVNNYYQLEVRLEGSTVGSQIKLWRIKAGGPTALATVDLSLSPLYPGIYYMYRVTIVDEGSDKRIKVFIDAVEHINYLDTDSLAQGTVALAAVKTPLEADEVEVVPLPVEDDFVDINS